MVVVMVVLVLPHLVVLMLAKWAVKALRLQILGNAAQKELPRIVVIAVV